MLKSSALSLMAKSNNNLFLPVIVLLMPFAFGEGSLVTFNTQQGCNATLVCNHPGNVTWMYTDTSEKVEGIRFQSRTHAFFSTLSIIDVSENDNKNITCMAEGHNRTINLAVCYDKIPSGQCRSTIDADPSGQTCKSAYMIGHCKKSCGLCPEPNCKEAVLPTLPPTTANSETTKDNTQSTTESRSTTTTLPTKVVDKDERDGNSGVALGSGHHNAFVLASILLAMTISEFLND